MVWRFDNRPPAARDQPPVVDGLLTPCQGSPAGLPHQQVCFIGASGVVPVVPSRHSYAPNSITGTHTPQKWCGYSYLAHIEGGAKKLPGPGPELGVASLVKGGGCA